MVSIIVAEGAGPADEVQPFELRKKAVDHGKVVHSPEYRYMTTAYNMTAAHYCNPQPASEHAAGG
jgi:hypothetical protein